MKIATISLFLWSLIFWGSPLASGTCKIAYQTLSEIQDKSYFKKKSFKPLIDEKKDLQGSLIIERKIPEGISTAEIIEIKSWLKLVKLTEPSVPGQKVTTQLFFKKGLESPKPGTIAGQMNGVEALAYAIAELLGFNIPKFYYSKDSGYFLIKNIPGTDMLEKPFDLDIDTFAANKKLTREKIAQWFVDPKPYFKAKDYLSLMQDFIDLFFLNHLLKNGDFHPGNVILVKESPEMTAYLVGIDYEAANLGQRFDPTKAEQKFRMSSSLLTNFKKLQNFLTDKKVGEKNRNFLNQKWSEVFPKHLSQNEEENFAEGFLQRLEEIIKSQ